MHLAGLRVLRESMLLPTAALVDVFVSPVTQKYGNLLPRLLTNLEVTEPRLITNPVHRWGFLCIRQHMTIRSTPTASRQVLCRVVSPPKSLPVEAMTRQSPLQEDLELFIPGGK